MSGKARLERMEMERFARYWAELLQAVPEARRKAVEAMGDAVRRELNIQIQTADLESGAKGTVRSWQTTRLGSRGGYSVVSPARGTVMSRDRRTHGWKMRQHTYRGAPITARQVTKWLERGHGTRNKGGEGYVKGRQFYSWTRARAWEQARRTADRVLSMIADEVEL